MTRFPWFPIILFALAVCCLLAYAREQAIEDAEWAATCAKIESELKR